MLGLKVIHIDKSEPAEYKLVVIYFVAHFILIKSRWDASSYCLYNTQT